MVPNTTRATRAFSGRYHQLHLDHHGSLFPYHRVNASPSKKACGIDLAGGWTGPLDGLSHTAEVSEPRPSLRCYPHLAGRPFMDGQDCVQRPILKSGRVSGGGAGILYRTTDQLKS